MNDKASTIIRLAQEHLGDPYVYGAWGSPCTPELRRKYARLNPSHAGNITKKCQALNGGGTSCAGCKWQGALAYDCRGFTHWLLKQVGIEIAGGGATSQYNTISNWAVRGKSRICRMWSAACSAKAETRWNIPGCTSAEDRLSIAVLVCRPATSGRAGRIMPCRSGCIRRTKYRKRGESR